MRLLVNGMIYFFCRPSAISYQRMGRVSFQSREPFNFQFGFLTQLNRVLKPELLKDAVKDSSLLSPELLDLKIR